MSHVLVNYNKFIYCNSQGKSRKNEVSHETMFDHDKYECESVMI
jgi:hypothetical protein